MTIAVDEKLQKFFDSSNMKDQINTTILKNERYVKINIQDLKEFDKDLTLDIIKNFSTYEKTISESLNKFAMRYFGNSLNLTFGMVNNFINHRIRDLKTEKIGCLVTFQATVTRTTQVRPEIISGVFICKVCGSKSSAVEQEYKYTEPLVCNNHLCSNRRSWRLLLDESEFCNWQRAHVQECNDEIPPGCLPRTFDVILRNELVEKIKAGDKVNFTGQLILMPDVVQLMLPQSKTVPILGGQEETLRKKRNFNIRDLNFKIGFLCNSIQLDNESEKNDFEQTEKHIIEKLRSTPDLYFRLSQSLFPTIHGHGSIKNAILLMLVGGVSKKTEDGISLRGDINILLVGDPGTAKSQFLKQTSNLIPRSVYTSGKSSSAAGLTASVLKDSETGDFAIEAGALMLSDNGVCCIDEFDKMNYKDQVSIHEAMEQQTISIAKAGIHATLNARCSILAAANPVSGRYDRKKTLRQNINLSAPIMSRFDLYFVLIDEMNEQQDRNIAMHILNNHSQLSKDTQIEGYFTLDEVKLYLRYVKRRTPQISPEVREYIKKKYVQLRQDSLVHTQNYKICVRHLETLIRLSEALAKIHCDDVKVSFVDEAYRLLQSSVIEVKIDDVNVTIDDEELKIESKDFIRITNSIVYILKSQEKMKIEDLIVAYLEENEGIFENEESLFNEKKKVSAVIDVLMKKEGVLFENDGFIYIHSDYDV
ncbi:DNA replication licensing factor mcm6 [Dictyocoela muelleri]|nr:DNA replication licensing factor mcm6 [Dictyocoela muelleri]